MVTTSWVSFPKAVTYLLINYCSDEYTFDITIEMHFWGQTLFFCRTVPSARNPFIQADDRDCPLSVVLRKTRGPRECGRALCFGKPEKCLWCGDVGLDLLGLNSTGTSVSVAGCSLLKQGCAVNRSGKLSSPELLGQSGCGCASVGLSIVPSCGNFLLV